MADTYTAVSQLDILVKNMQQFKCPSHTNKLTLGVLGSKSQGIKHHYCVNKFLYIFLFTEF